MMLNKVDLPQPDGPITARNSPGLTPSETRSTAVSGPSGVSNRLTISSTTRNAVSVEADAAATGGVDADKDTIAMFWLYSRFRSKGIRPPVPSPILRTQGPRRMRPHATAADATTTRARDRRSRRSVRQKAEPPLRRNDGSGVIATR